MIIKTNESVIMVVKGRVHRRGKRNVHLISSHGFSRHVCNCVVIEIIIKVFGGCVVEGVRSFVSRRGSRGYILSGAIVWVMFRCILLAVLASEEFAVGRVMSYFVTMIAFGFGHMRGVVVYWRGSR
jgi:hypothetical protein